MKHYQSEAYFFSLSLRALKIQVRGFTSKRISRGYIRTRTCRSALHSLFSYMRVTVYSAQKKKGGKTEERLEKSTWNIEDLLKDFWCSVAILVSFFVACVYIYDCVSVFHPMLYYHQLSCDKLFGWFFFVSSGFQLYRKDFLYFCKQSLEQSLEEKNVYTITLSIDKNKKKHRHSLNSLIRVSLKNSKASKKLALQFRPPRVFSHYTSHLFTIRERAVCVSRHTTLSAYTRSRHCCVSSSPPRKRKQKKKKTTLLKGDPKTRARVPCIIESSSRASHNFYFYFFSSTRAALLNADELLIFEYNIEASRICLCLYYIYIIIA